MKRGKYILTFMLCLAFVSFLFVGCDTSTTPTEYSISVAKVGEGTVNVAESAKVGETVEINVQAGDGYLLSELYMNDKQLTQYSFVMPEENVTVFACFTLDPEREKINLKQGIYAAKAYGETNYDTTAMDSWSTYTLLLNIKENNQYDLFGCLYNNGPIIEITNQTYTRDGNKLNASYGEFVFNCEIINEDMILYFSQSDGIVVVFCYTEQVSLANGSYEANIDNNQKISLSIEENNVEVKLYNQELVDEKHMTSKIVGNRLYLVDTSTQEKYAAIISYNDGEFFTLSKFGTRINEHWVILYQQLDFIKNPN